MSARHAGWSSMGFVKTFVLPGFLIFLVPVAALGFFLHAESRFNAQARESVLASIREDATLSPQERERAVAFFTSNRFSDLMKNDEFAQQFPKSLRFDFATFRWMIRLSLLSIVASVAVFTLAGICVLLSFTSQRSQYLSLSIGWQVLRFHAALQTIIQGGLLVALSYWVTALWGERHYPKLIFITGLLALLGAVAVLLAIFKRIDLTTDVEGKLLDPTQSRPFFDALNAVCRKVGTAPPDQVVVGIDDNFFVTESPVRVEGRTLTGRTLFASLSLLKEMNATEAEGVLAHEAAHFSGADTFYSKKTAPLLERYQRYLEVLHDGGIGHVVFYYMNCFRALFELSFGRLCRQREFRADRIAAEATSARRGFRPAADHRLLEVPQCGSATPLRAGRSAGEGQHRRANCRGLSGVCLGLRRATRHRRTDLVAPLRFPSAARRSIGGVGGAVLAAVGRRAAGLRRATAAGTG